MSGSWATFFEAVTAATLLISAVGKLAARASLRSFLVALGAPPMGATAAAALVVPLELTIGVGLLLPPTSGSSAWVAVVLASLFVGAQGLALRLVHVPSCGCVGFLEVEGARSGFPQALFIWLMAASAIGAEWLSDDSQGSASSWMVTNAVGFLSGAGSLLAFSLVSQVLRFERTRPRFIPGAVFVATG